MNCDDWISRIRNPDPMTFEDAYFGSRPGGPDVVPKLVAALHGSTDPVTRGKFCELLGEMGDNSILPILTHELSHEDETVRRWAALALEEIQSPELRASKQQHLGHFRISES